MIQWRGPGILFRIIEHAKSKNVNMRLYNMNLMSKFIGFFFLRIKFILHRMNILL